MTSNNLVKVGFVLDPHFSSHPLMSRKDDYTASILNKLQQVRALGIDHDWVATVVAGDLFHTATLSWGAYTALVRIVKDWHVLPGNHDIRWRRLDLLDETPLGAMVTSGVVHDLSVTPLILSNDTAIRGYAYSDTPDPPVAISLNDWLVLHQYVGPPQEWWESENHRISLEQIDALGYAGIIAGHDHVVYPVAYSPEYNVPVFRFGSLSRGSKHEHNRNRIPQVMEVTFNLLSHGYTVRLIELDTATDVFRESALKQSVIDKDMRSFIKSLEAANVDDETNEEELTARQILARLVKDSEIETPVEVVAHTHQYFDEFGIL